METLTGKQQGRPIPFSALLVTGVLLAGIAVLAMMRFIRWPATGLSASGAGPLLSAFYFADFGRIAPQQHPTIRFPLTNQSARIVEIEHVIPSCSCITASCTPRNLAPGRSAVLSITYRGFPGAFGPFGKSVAVVYRTASNRDRLSLKVFVRGDAVSNSPIVLYPQSIYLGHVAPGGEVESSLYIRGWTDLLRSLPTSVSISRFRQGADAG